MAFGNCIRSLTYFQNNDTILYDETDTQDKTFWYIFKPGLSEQIFLKIKARGQSRLVHFMFLA